MFYKEKYTGIVSRSKSLSDKQESQFVKLFRFYRNRYRKDVPLKRFYDLCVFKGAYKLLKKPHNDEPVYYVPKDNNEPLTANPRFKLQYAPVTTSSYDGKETDRFISDEWGQNPLL